jgi:prevent-host-death family protein
MRLKVSEDVVPITELRQNSAKIVARQRKSRRPILITQRGRPAAILESAEEYERRLERLELFEKVNRGAAGIREGRRSQPSRSDAGLKEAAAG